MTVLLVGDGRLATSLAPYLRAKGVPLFQWSRKMPCGQEGGPNAALAAGLAQSDVVLIAIRDDAIVSWVEAQGTALAGKQLVHFSGALVADGIVGLHPLYAFSSTPVPLAQMETIPFVAERGRTGFAEIFPTLPNPHVAIDAAQKPFYHALAVLSGNLATYLWNEVAGAMADELDLPAGAMMAPYLHSLVANFHAAPRDSLTGPVKRGDRQTIAKNLAALEDQPGLHQLYTAFVAAALPPD